MSIDIAELDDTEDKVYIFGIGMENDGAVKAIRDRVTPLFNDARTFFIRADVDDDLVIGELDEDQLRKALMEEEDD